ncbi:MAG: hypothetical protein JO130_12535 [Solirubrobacterales bacterium]|nr:hypothetical protein [Solirubrobacterales bacterium]
MDFFEVSALAVFGLLSASVLALDLWQVVVHGRVWTGTDGVYTIDQLQYVAWIRAVADHGLASNLFVLHPTPADYFQPAIMISGGLTALGVAPWLSLLLWKPVAVVAFFLAVRAYVDRNLAGRWPRRTALVLAVFFGSFSSVYGAFNVLGDLSPVFLTWGYTLGVMALAAMVATLVAYGDARATGRRLWLPGLLGALASSLHPWNGELLIALIIAAEVVMLLDPRRRRARVAWPDRRRFSREDRLVRRERLLRLLRGVSRERWLVPAVAIGGTALPLLYYAVLVKADTSWSLAQQASKHSFPFWSIAIAIAPLLLPAAVAYRRPPATFLAAATRAWPVAAFGIFLLSGTSLGATPLHAFQGITVPLAVLAVEGIQMLGWRRLERRMLIGTALVAVFTIPAMYFEINEARINVAPSPAGSNFITRGERDALGYLARDREAGGVLTNYHLGDAVPGFTGRSTYVGDCLWSEPNCAGRAVNMGWLFSTNATPAAARSFVLGTRARFVLADCMTTADMRSLLGPIVRSEHTFGCAAVYEVE